MTLGFDLSEICNDYDCNTYFETGLGYCDEGEVSLKQALKCNFEKCISVEIDKRFVDTGQDVFKNEINNGKCILHCGDSATLSNYTDDIEGKCLFFLDAHIQQNMGDNSNYTRRCPLMEELECIKKLDRKDHIICIDDVRIITGCKWGDHQDIDLLKQIKNKIKEINSDYKFERLDGHIAEDVLFAHL